jgi:hypothetical protein
MARWDLAGWCWSRWPRPWPEAGTAVPDAVPDMESWPPRGYGQARPGAPETSGSMPRSRRWPSTWPAGTGGTFRRGPGCLNVRHGRGGSSPTCAASTRAPWSSRRLRSAAAASSLPARHLTAYERRSRAGGHPRAPRRPIGGTGGTRGESRALPRRGRCPGRGIRRHKGDQGPRCDVHPDRRSPASCQGGSGTPATHRRLAERRRRRARAGRSPRSAWRRRAFASSTIPS